MKNTNKGNGWTAIQGWNIRYSSPCGRTSGTAFVNTHKAKAYTLDWMNAEGYAYDIVEVAK